MPLLSVIAAPPGHDLLTYDPPGGGEPALCFAEPIVAWAVFQEDDERWIEPVTVDQFGYPSYGPSAVRFPDGRVQQRDNACYDHVELWKHEKTRAVVWRAVIAS